MSEHKNMYEQNPNPNARYGFLLHYPFQFYPLKDVYYQFENEAEFIIDFAGEEDIYTPAYENLIQLLTRKGVFFRVLPKAEHASLGFLEIFFSRYQALIGLAYKCCFLSLANKNRLKIRLEYGVGKDLAKFAPSQSYFDLILLQGERPLGLLQYYTNCAVVGNPRFDDWFNKTIDRSFLEATKSLLDASRQTLLYVPTHSQLSTVDSMLDALVAAKEKYNVLIKLHHITVYEEPEKIALLLNRGFLVFDDMTDTLPLYTLADVVLGDNGSALFEALLIKKPLIAADFFSDEFLEEDYWSLTLNSKRRRGIQTYPGSFEQRLKKTAAFCITSPAELSSALEQALAHPDSFLEERENLIQEASSFNDGKCAIRARQAIEKFLSAGRSPAKPVLYHVFDAYARGVRAETLRWIKKMPLLEKCKFIYKNFL